VAPAKTDKAPTHHSIPNAVSRENRKDPTRITASSGFVNPHHNDRVSTTKPSRRRRVALILMTFKGFSC
jgi:hypothetical protein